MILGICMAIIVLSILLLTLFFLYVYLESKREVHLCEHQVQTDKEKQPLIEKISDKQTSDKCVGTILGALTKDLLEAYDYPSFYHRDFSEGKDDMEEIIEAVDSYLKEAAHKEDSKIEHKHNHNRRKFKVKLSDVISIEDNDYIIRQDGRNVPVLQNINKFKQKKNGN